MKYINLKKIILGALLVVTYSMIGACTEDDGLNSPELKVYVKNVELVVDLVQTPSDKETSKMDEIEFPVCSSRDLLADAEVAFDIDPSLIESYNNKNGTRYQSIPVDLLSFTTNAVMIKKGSMESADLVKLKVANRTELTALEGYLIPVKISTVTSDDKGLVSSTNRSVVYVIIKTAFEYINEREDKVDGDVVDRGGWNITSSSSSANNAAKCAIDGKKDTSWSSTFIYLATSPWVSIDMGQVETLKGLRFTPNYTKRNYIPKKMDVSISFDGEIWASIGYKTMTEVSEKSSIEDPDYKYVKFDIPVKARYLRFTFVENYAKFASVAEIDAYK